MPIRSIRIITFLIFTVLVRSCSCMNCTCMCLYHHTEHKYGNVCDMINKLQTEEDVNGFEIMELSRRAIALKSQFNDFSAEVRKATRNIPLLESTVESLKSESRKVLNQVLDLNEYTLKEIRVASEARSKLRDEIKILEYAMRDSERKRDTLDERLKNLENMFLEAQGTLSAKFQDMENKTRKLEEETASKSKEHSRRMSEVRKELLKQVKEMEMQTNKTKTEVLVRLGETESVLREKDSLIQQMQKEIDEMTERSRKVETKSNKLEAKMKKMKKTVSKLENEIRTNISLSVEHLKAYTDDHFTHLKQISENLKSNVSQIDGSLVRVEHELSNCATIGNLSDLDRIVKEGTNASSVEHQSLRTEMSIRDEEVRKQCADRDDVTEMNRTLDGLSTDLQEIQDYVEKKKEESKTKCEDTLPIATCTSYVQYHMCRFENTATKCCASCAKSVGWVPKRTSGRK